MLDKIRHEIILKQILRDIYTESRLQSSLSLKGGTCLYLFHQMDRFSVDLDFNLTDSSLDTALIDQIVQSYLTIEERREKYFTWFWLGSYEAGKQKIKLEINKRDYPDTYETRDFYGLTIPTMSKESMFAHKLCAITDRVKMQNRDLYDTWFMFKHNFPVQDEIIQIRTGKQAKTYLKELRLFIKKHADKKNLLHGLGELLDDKQKIFVKEKLLDELLFQLQIYIESQAAN